MILTGDIGGTNARFALFQNSNPVPIRHWRYLNQDFKTFEHLLNRLEQDIPETLSKAVFAVAGPVVPEDFTLTNIMWTISRSKIQEILKVSKIEVINDMAATAWSLPLLHGENLVTLSPGKNPIPGNQGVISPGTGLGEGGSVYWKNQHIGFGCEGGHTDLAARNEKEWKLILFLQKKLGLRIISYEKILSGPGILNLFDFVESSEGLGITASLSLPQDLRDKRKAITKAGLEKSCKACEETLKLFVSFLGAEAGNLCVKLKATGGIYMGGGIAPQIEKALFWPEFLESYHQKIEMKHLTEKTPIYLIREENANRIGAYAYSCHV